MVVLARHKLVFCPIPKVACSPWKRTLRRALGFQDWEASSPHDRRANGLSYLDQFGPVARATFLLRPDYTRAVFVRNPWTRCVSAFRSKLEGKTRADVDGEPGGWRSKVFEFTHSGPLSFDDFLAFLDGQSADEMNEHWKPQTTIAGLDAVRYDFIGRFENLVEDAAALVRNCGLPPFYEGHVGRGATHADQVVERYLTPDRIDRIGSIYATDIEILGYQPPI
jgi:hypothetical protein